jgi:hypothetical protein
MRMEDGMTPPPGPLPQEGGGSATSKSVNYFWIKTCDKHPEVSLNNVILLKSNAAGAG